MPVDADPTASGNVTLTDEDKGVIRARVFPTTAAAPEDTALYTSHFATCPDAAKHRR